MDLLTMETHTNTPVEEKEERRRKRRILQPVRITMRGSGAAGERLEAMNDVVADIVIELTKGQKRKGIRGRQGSW